MARRVSRHETPQETTITLALASEPGLGGPRRAGHRWSRTPTVHAARRRWATLTAMRWITSPRGITPCTGSQTCLRSQKLQTEEAAPPELQTEEGSATGPAAKRLRRGAIASNRAWALVRL